MENKEVKIESSMGERFDETFEDYGGEYSSNIDAPRKMLKSFIQSEIDLAVAKREKEIVKGIINIPVTTLRDDEFKGYIINLITNK